jgi:hypothetical protein
MTGRGVPEIDQDDRNIFDPIFDAAEIWDWGTWNPSPPVITDWPDQGTPIDPGPFIPEEPADGNPRPTEIVVETDGPGWWIGIETTVEEEMPWEDCCPHTRADIDGAGATVYPSVPLPSTKSIFTEEGDGHCHPTTKISEFVAVKVVLAMDINIISAAKALSGRGDTVLLDRFFSAAERDGKAQINTISIKNHRAGTEDKTRKVKKINGGSKQQFSYDSSFEVSNKNIKDLAVFSYMSLDIERMQQDFGFDMASNFINNSSKDLFNFKVSMNKIIEKGNIVDTGVILVLPSGKTWTGAYHYHRAKGFMGGERHTTNAHPVLYPQKVINLTVKNHMVKNEIMNLDISNIMKSKQSKMLESIKTGFGAEMDKITRSFISEPYKQKSIDGKARFIFHIDLAGILKMQSRFPGIYSKAAFNGSAIRNIEVLRRRAADPEMRHGSFSKVGVPKISGGRLCNLPEKEDLISVSSDIAPAPEYVNKGQLTASDYKTKKHSLASNRIQNLDQKLIGSIKEINVANSSDLRTFLVVDHEIADMSDGAYQYVVNVEIQDPTIRYLNGKLKMMQAARFAAEKLFAEASVQNNYNSLHRSFTRNYKKHQKSHMKTLTAITMIVVSTLQCLADTKMDKKIISYFLSIASDMTGSPGGIGTIVEILNNLEGKIIDLLGDNRYSVGLTGKVEKIKTTQKNLNDYGAIKVRKEFDDVLMKNGDKDVGYEFIQTSTPKHAGFSYVNRTDYVTRQLQEKEKYWPRKGAPQRISPSKLDSSLSSKQKEEAITRLGENTTNQFTVSKVYMGESSMELVGENSEIDNLDKYKDIVGRIVNYNSSQKSLYPLNSENEIAEDVLSQVGIAVQSDSGCEDEESYLTDTSTLFGANNFDSRNIDKTLESDDDTLDDRFIAEATREIANIINSKLAETGELSAGGNYAVKWTGAPRKRTDRESDIALRLSINKFDLRNADNLANELSVRHLRDMPQGIRSLFFGRSQSSRNWLDNQKDLLTDPELKNIFKFNYSNVVEVEYFAGYESTSFGHQLKAPIFNPLTPTVLKSIPKNAPLLCRLKKVFNPQIGVGIDRGIELEVFSEHFLITSTGTPRYSFSTNVSNRRRELTNYMIEQVNRLASLQNATAIHSVLMK